MQRQCGVGGFMLFRLLFSYYSANPTPTHHLVLSKTHRKSTKKLKKSIKRTSAKSHSSKLSFLLLFFLCSIDRSIDRWILHRIVSSTDSEPFIRSSAAALVMEVRIYNVLILVVFSSSKCSSIV